MSVTVHDLRPGRDPVELIRSLGQVTLHDTTRLRTAVAILCDHDDPDVQSEALQLATVRWRLAEFRPKVIDLIDSPYTPSEVREAALYGLAAISGEATRDQDTDLLVEIVMSDQEEDSVRGAAYDALLIVHHNPRFPTKRREFDPQLDVDHAWLRQLLDQRGSRKRGG